MHSELWFPNVIWSAIVHAVDNTAIKKWAYDKKRNDPGRRVSNYIGYQSTDIKQKENTEIDTLINYVNKEIYNCCEQVGLPQCKIYNIWLNINPPGAYNTLHNHAGALFSGVYFVDANPDMGNLLFERGDGAEYFLPDQQQQLTYYNCSKTMYAAKTNALYIFPGWLKHCVEGNKTNQDRISLSFNYTVV